jgi:hypothetical protein
VADELLEYLYRLTLLSKAVAYYIPNSSNLTAGVFVILSDEMIMLINLLSATLLEYGTASGEEYKNTVIKYEQVYGYLFYVSTEYDTFLSKYEIDQARIERML